MTLIPINGHVQVKPIQEEGLFSRTDPKYEEKGVVVMCSNDLAGMLFRGEPTNFPFNEGDIVYFDGWLCAKYGDEENPIWLVKAEDIRAIDRS